VSMKYWLLKSEPESFSWADLLAKGATGETWDGVRNHQAAAFLKQMLSGDQGLFYHSGKERRVVGTLEVTHPHYPDPSDQSGRFVAVTVRALETLTEPVTLAAVKVEPAFREFLLVRNPRLSVMPVTAAHWRRIQRMAQA